MGRRLKKHVQRIAFLIVCEGEQTEKHYFQSFRSKKVALDIRPFIGQPLQIVDRAVALGARRDYDEVWVVFDLDYDSSQGKEQYQAFERALKVAREEGVKVAYSIDAFELWFRLHYEAVTVGLTRKSLYKDLSKRWGINYESSGKQAAFAKTIFGKLAEDKDADVLAAIKRAEKLWEERQYLPIAEQNPITTVHLLVKRLLELAE
ncbi:MAG: RloB family protein [Bacteroidota bacterium]